MCIKSSQQRKKLIHFKFIGEQNKISYLKGVMVTCWFHLEISNLPAVYPKYVNNIVYTGSGLQTGHHNLINKYYWLFILFIQYLYRLNTDNILFTGRHQNYSGVAVTLRRSLLGYTGYQQLNCNNLINYYYLLYLIFQEILPFHYIVIITNNILSYNYANTRSYNNNILSNNNVTQRRTL